MRTYAIEILAANGEIEIEQERHGTIEVIYLTVDQAEAVCEMIRKAADEIKEKKTT